MIKRALTALGVLGALTVGIGMAGERRAHADILAAYVQGHGGVSSTDAENRSSMASNGLAPGLGFQVGARLFIFEGYFDRTAFGQGAAVSRGILGLRAGLGAAGLRFILRAGGGVLQEEGGALTGVQLGLGDRRGVVARAGIEVEKRLVPKKFLAGLGIDGEAFSLHNPGASPFGSSRTQGTDVFASLHIKFELGL
jgi:hypothetical protein